MTSSSQIVVKQYSRTAIDRMENRSGECEAVEWSVITLREEIIAVNRPTLRWINQGDIRRGSDSQSFSLLRISANFCGRR
jgi:hypothetical protein